MKLFENLRLSWLAKRLGASYFNLQSDVRIHRAMRDQIRTLQERMHGRNQKLPDLRNRILTIYASSTSSSDAISKMYDVEYGEDNYGFVNALLSPHGFEAITGYSVAEARKLAYLDIGAGSNELLRFLNKELNVSARQLSGADVSGKSAAIVKRDGFSSYVGRAEQLPLPGNSLDCVFLSYFIDYDTDQRATFKAAVRLVRPGGKLVFEGLLPAISFLTSKNETSCITKGRTAPDDIRRICDAILDIAGQQSRLASIEKICAGRRYIYNRLGLRHRSSYFIVVKIM